MCVQGHPTHLTDAPMHASSNPKVIAMPVRNGTLIPEQTRVFDNASVRVKNGIAQVLEHDVRAGAIPHHGEPQRPDVAWKGTGRAWFLTNLVDSDRR